MTSIPKISIVTPSFNQGHFIEETILSIINQDYPNIEYIIIDGGSTDTTVNIIKKYDDRITYWESRRDEGQSDALNKGFERATGDICCYLNSDDCFYPNAFKEIVKVFQEKNAKWVASSSVVSERSDIHSRIWPPDVSSFPFFINQQTFPQQGVFWRSDAVPRPYFNSTFFYAMDHDLFCRLYHQYGPPETTPFITSFFRVQANSKTTLFEERLISDMTKTREHYLKLVDVDTRKLIENEYVKLESVKLLQHKLRNKQKLSLSEASKMIIRTPYKFRDRQFFVLLTRALLGAGISA